MLRPINEREIAGVDLSKCRIVAAGNKADVAADGGYLAKAMALRWAHFHIEPDPMEWIEGELAGWGDKERPKHHIECSALVCSFIRSKPSSLMPGKDMPKDPSGSSGEPRPRTWSYAARMLASCYTESARSTALTDVGFAVVRSIVGDGAAQEFITYATSMDLADPEEYLRGKKLPSRGDKEAAALDAVVAAVLSNNTEDRIHLAWKVLAKARKDVAIIPARVLLDNCPTVGMPQEAMDLGRKLVELKSM
jgi:hypothetical protein